MPVTVPAAECIFRRRRITFRLRLLYTSSASRTGPGQARRARNARLMSVQLRPRFMLAFPPERGRHPQRSAAGAAQRPGAGDAP